MSTDRDLMGTLKAWSPTLLPLVIALALPLAGAILAIQALATGERDQGVRIGLATLVGAALWAVVLTR